MIEYFDLVDQHDRPTGRLVTREESHQQALRHRIAAVQVFRPDGKLWVQIRKSSDGKLDHAVGGHVSAGEDYQAAAAREMQEEVGLTTALEHIATVVPPVDYYSRIASHELHAERYRHTFGVFRTTSPSTWAFTPTDEVDELISMDVAEIVRLMNSDPGRFISGFFITLAAYLRELGSALQIRAYGIKWEEL